MIRFPSLADLCVRAGGCSAPSDLIVSLCCRIEPACVSPILTSRAPLCAFDHCLLVSNLCEVGFRPAAADLADGPLSQRHQRFNNQILTATNCKGGSVNGGFKENGHSVINLTAVRKRLRFKVTTQAPLVELYCCSPFTELTKRSHNIAASSFSSSIVHSLHTSGGSSCTS